MGENADHTYDSCMEQFERFCGLPQKSHDNEISRECNISIRLVHLTDGVVGFGQP